MTLLEVLIAVGISAFLVVAVNQAIRQTLQRNEALRDARALEEEGTLIVDLLAEDLRHLPLFLMDASAERFSGRLDQGLARLDFVSSRDSIATESAIASDLTEVGYRLKPVAGASDLRRLERREDFFVDAKPLEGGTWTPVSERVRSLKIEYLAPDNPNTWSETFSSQQAQAPPQGVRITLVLSRPEPADPSRNEERTFRLTIPTQ